MRITSNKRIKEFKIWLVEQGKNPKVAKDMCSRVIRVESEFKKSRPEFTLDLIFAEDKGQSIKKMFLPYGRNLPDEIDLPRGKSIYPIANAVQWYFKFLELSENANP